MSAALDSLPKESRKELEKVATVAYKSGAEPNRVDTSEAPKLKTRAQQRQLARELGWRGAKAKRQNIAGRLQELDQVIMVDAALNAAENRAQHPLKSRLRRR